ncbi:hypothetical protein CYMTET_51973, partial [Cymbomonas tetramitiformis]
GERVVVCGVGSKGEARGGVRWPGWPGAAYCGVRVRGAWWCALWGKGGRVVVCGVGARAGASWCAVWGQGGRVVVCGCLCLTIFVLFVQLDFLSAMVFNPESAEWVAEGLKLNYPSKMEGLGKAPLVQQLSEALLQGARDAQKKAPWRGRAHTYLRLFSALTVAGMLPPSQPQIDFWLSELSAATRWSSGMVRLGSALLFSLACEAQVGGSAALLNTALRAVLLCGASARKAPPSAHAVEAAGDSSDCHMVDATEDGVKAAATVAEVEAKTLAVWLRVHLLVGQIRPLQEELQRAIGMQLIPAESIKALAALAAKEGLLEPADVAAALMELPSPQNLGARTPPSCSSALALYMDALLQLLMIHPDLCSTAGLHSLVEGALLAAEDPLHPALPALVSTLVSPARAPPHQMPGAVPAPPPLLPDKLQCVLHGSSRLAAQVLVGYYVMCLEEAEALQGCIEGREMLLAALPMETLCAHVQRQAKKDEVYAALMPRFVGLAAWLLPDCCSAEHLMDPAPLQCSSSKSFAAAVLQAASQPAPPQEVAAEAAHRLDVVKSSAVPRGRSGRTGEVTWTEAAVRGAMARASVAPLEAALCLEALIGRSPDCSQPVDESCDAIRWPTELAVVQSLGPQLVDAGCQRRLQHLFHTWWAALPRPVRSELLPHLLRALGGLQEGGVVSLAELHRAPLAMLTCHPAVWTVPSLVAVLLGELSSILEASRRALAHSQVVRPDELANVTLAQMSAVVQMLLETCQTAEGRVCEEHDYHECRTLIFSYLHKLFLEDPLLLKCVHFQGYDAGVLQKVVAEVPCMHACVAFVPELLAQPKPAQQLFGALLAFHLAAQYPLEASLAAAQMALDRACAAVDAADDQYLEVVVEALTHAAAALPQLLPQTLHILRYCVSSGSPSELRAKAKSAFEELAQRRILLGELPRDTVLLERS